MSEELRRNSRDIAAILAVLKGLTAEVDRLEERVKVLEQRRSTLSLREMREVNTNQ